MSLENNLNYDDVMRLAVEHGDSFFVLNTHKLAFNAQKFIAEFKKYYKNFQLAYSYKTNYTPEVCKILNSLGVYAEVVSEMEYWLAKRINVPSDRIIYNGPYKSKDSFFAAAREGSIINLDSDRDFKLLQEVLNIGCKNEIKIAIRCNFEIDKGFSSRFGFDVNAPDFSSFVKILENTKGVDLIGVHCHFPHRTSRTYIERINGLFDVIRKNFKKPVKHINVGGGFYSNMPVEMSNEFSEYSTIENYASVIGNAMLNEFGNGPDAPMLYAEPGTAIVADAMSFYCRIISKKRVGSRIIATASGSLFNFSASARAKNLPMKLIPRCSNLNQGSDLHTDIAGYTCIEGDVLSQNVKYNIEVNDFVKFENAGSYSIVMKPPFILPSVAILADDGTVFKVIKYQQTNSGLFEDYVF